MEFIQKKKSNKHTFTLHDEYFNFAYEDKSGSGDVDLNYGDFPQKSSVRIEQNEWLRNVGYLWMALGALQLGLAIASDASLSGKGFWLFLGALCVAWAHFSTVRYSVFHADGGSVFVIQDKQHDQIIEQLNTRRKAQLLRWYGEINAENDLQREIEKFKWLAQQKVMSVEESEQKIAQVELLQKDVSDAPSERLN